MENFRVLALYKQYLQQCLCCRVNKFFFAPFFIFSGGFFTLQCSCNVELSVVLLPPPCLRNGVWAMGTPMGDVYAATPRCGSLYMSRALTRTSRTQQRHVQLPTQLGQLERPDGHPKKLLPGCGMCILVHEGRGSASLIGFATVHRHQNRFFCSLGL
jgi:hypothetical protein